MALFQEDLRNVLNYYLDVMNYYSNVYENSPDGSLIYQKNHGADQFMRYHHVNGEAVREVITNDENMKRKLAQKEFAKRSLDVLTPNVELLEKIIGKITPYNPDDILMSMGKAYHKLPEDNFFERARLIPGLHLEGETEERIARHKEWGAQDYIQSDYLPQYKRIKTSKGLYVRSKSEALISETLYRYGIPHRYEQEQIMDDMFIAPDFTFEDYTRSQFYWEHLGKMDDPEYAERNFRKMRRYYDAGLIPGDNLILSFDRNGTIDMKYIEGIVENEVIPRL